MESAAPSASNELTNSLGALKIDSSLGTPQHAMPGVSQPEALKKQLFGPDEEGIISPGDVGNGGQVAREGQSVEEGGAGSAAEEGRQGRAGRTSARESAIPVATSSAADSLPCTPPMPEPASKPLSQDLKVVLDPRRYSAAAQAISGQATGVFGMSPGSRAFAPPFGARFGDRDQGPEAKAGENREGMEGVREEQDGAAEGFQGRDVESTSDSAVPAASSAGNGEDLRPAKAGLQASDGGGPSAPPVAGTAAAASAAVPQALPQELHAPRVATTATTVLGKTGSEGTSSTLPGSQNGPRLRMAFEGKRDEEVFASADSSKFAPTPRVKPKDGLPWQP